MLKRKLISLFLSTIISMTIIFGFIFAEWQNPLELLLMVVMYSLLFSPIIIGYGLTASVLVEFVTRRINGLLRQIITIILLLILALSSVLLFPGDMTISILTLDVDLTIIAAVMIATFAFLIEEIFKYKHKLINVNE